MVFLGNFSFLHDNYINSYKKGQLKILSFVGKKETTTFPIKFSTCYKFENVVMKRSKGIWQW
jgi:hypothetical protein